MDDALTELRAELASLRAEVAVSRSRIAQLEAAQSAVPEGPSTSAEPATEPTTRRNALRVAAGAVAGAAGAMVAASPAVADDPNDITLGQNKVHTGGVTRAGNTGTADSMAFLFVAGNPGAGTGPITPAALGGWSSQSNRPTGIFGFTNQNGIGVVGICRRNSGAVFPLSQVGVFGWTDVPTRPGVLGESITAGPGVRGEGDVGVEGIANSGGVGLSGIAPGGFGAQLLSQRAGLSLFSPIAAVNSRAPYGTNPAAFGTRDQGEVLYTSSNVSDAVVDQGLWVCVEPGDPGSWRCLAGPESAGTLFPITPIRIYDSRFDMNPDPDGPLPSGTTRTFSAANARNVETGTITTTNAIPERARAVAYNLTATQTTSAGFLLLAPGGTTTVTASTINWTGTTTIANAGIVPLDDQRRLTALCGGELDASTQFLVDITGYYL